MNPYLTPVQTALAELGQGVARVGPQIIIAIIVFAIGALVASILARAIEQLFKAAKIDSALAAIGLDRVVSRSGYHLNAGKFVGELVRWFVIVAFLIATLDILGLDEVNAFLKDGVLAFVVNVITAALVLVATVIIADAVRKLVVASARATSVAAANAMGMVAKWAIWVFGGSIALVELGVGTILIQRVVTGIVVAFSLAVGLAFGLGGKEAAARLIERVRGEISERLAPRFLS
jgi:hypothetical protein